MLAQEEMYHRPLQRGLSLEEDQAGLYYAGYDEIIDPDENLMDDEWLGSPLSAFSPVKHPPLKPRKNPSCILHTHAVALE